MHKGFKKQQGLSLIELITAMGLGVLLLVALAMLMTSINKTSSQRVSGELADETARQVFSRIESNLAMAGYIDPFSDKSRAGVAFNTTNKLVIERYAKHKNALKADKSNKYDFSLMGALTKGGLIPVWGCGTNTDANSNCPDSSITNRQTLITAFEAIRPKANGKYAALSNDSQENAINSGISSVCQAVGGKADDEHSMIVNKFWLDTPNGENNSSLYCYSFRFKAENGTSTVKVDSNNATGAPLVGNIEQLTFRYLMTNMNESNSKTLSVDALDKTLQAGRSINSYLNAPSVRNTDLGWSGVVGVETCIIVAVENYDNSRNLDIVSLQPTIPNCLRVGNSESAYAPFIDNSPRPDGDNRLYRRYLRTFSVPNNINAPLVEL